MSDFFEDESKVSDQSGSKEEERSRSGSDSGSGYGSEDSAFEGKEKKKNRKRKSVLSDDEDKNVDEEIGMLTFSPIHYKPLALEVFQVTF
jgi:hypothetical protein